MQTRTITVDYARPRGYDVGYRAENNFTLLALPVPEELEGADSYRVYFESTVGEYLQTEILTPADGYVTVKITSDVVPEPGNMAAQLVAFADGEIVGYAPMITGSAKVSIPDGTERLSHSLAAEIALNTAARHSHENKAVLDKFAESKDGKPTYDGEALGGGGGASDFIIKMTVASDDDGNYTVTSCDATVEQIDAAVSAEKRVIVIASYEGVIANLPMLQGVKGDSYYFGMFLSGLMMISSVYKVDGNTSKWEFDATQIQSESVGYSNDALPNISTVGGALDELVPKSHTHDNKDILDKLSASNGKLQYNGSDVGLKGDTGADGKTPIKGTDYWTAADKQEIIDDIHPAYYIDLAGEYPNYTCPVAMDDIKVAYNSGYNLICRCTLGAYTATLPLFIPMPAANTWFFSGSGALKSMGFDAQSFTVAIMSNGVVVQQTPLNKPLNITAGGKIYTYDGSNAVSVAVKTEAYSVTTTDGSVVLADNTEYRLTNLSTLTLTYPTTNFECWLRLSFATSGTITVTLPTDTEYLGATPNFKNGETWELSFKDRVLVAQKVGDSGTISAPVKGVDYWTESDKEEIVNDVIAALPDGTEVSY